MSNHIHLCDTTTSVCDRSPAQSKGILTEVVVEGELVIVPDLDGEFWRYLGLSFVQTPEMLL